MPCFFDWASRVNGHRFSASLKNATFYLSVASFGLRGYSDDFGGSGVLWYSLKGSLGVTDCSSVRTGTLRLCIWAHLKVVEVRMFGPPFRRGSAFSSIVRWSVTFLTYSYFSFFFLLIGHAYEGTTERRDRWYVRGGRFQSGGGWCDQAVCGIFRWGYNAHSFFSLNIPLLLIVKIWFLATQR